MTGPACPMVNSAKRRFYRPDWSRSPGCHGCEGCTGQQHRCHVFGLPGMCQWPKGIVQDNHSSPWWWPARDAGLAERWL